MRRRLVAASAALVLFVVGALVLVAYVRGADARALAGAQPVQVLVVDQPVPAGTPGEELAEYVRSDILPAKAAVEGRVADLAALDGLVATTDLEPGEQLLASRFEQPDQRQAAGTVQVPTGLQEVSVLLDPQRAVGGRLAAGDTVGVYLSQVLGDLKQTHGVLHRVLVTQVQGAPAAPDPAAAAGTETAASSSAPASSLMVTLAVDAQDAETVIFGAEHGTLWLSLEPEGSETGGTRVVQPENVYGGVPR
ncbi:MAG: cpaB [Blastococcus sp.]|nr:cpaB [Blastococcus sp.]